MIVVKKKRSKSRGFGFRGFTKSKTHFSKKKRVVELPPVKLQPWNVHLDVNVFKVG